MAGQQRYQIPAILDQNVFHIMGIDDPDFCHPVGQGFPDVGDGHDISDLKLFDVPEVTGTVIAPVTGNDAVGVLTANGQAGLTEMGGTVCHVLIGSAQIDGHFQFHGRNGNDPKDFIFEAILG